MIYLDTSALAKLLHVEAETKALLRYLARHGQPAGTSVVGVVELRRVAGRLGGEYVAGAQRVLGPLRTLRLDDETSDLAARIPPTSLRTLDALHVASAARIADLTALVTYDTAMAQAAHAWGLLIETPR